ncbi:hypothetical protein EV363DRAFT_1418085 [Boletus edulis]|nr:hypothetical protein EV363DRAFT_1418085 [Boletus edulis]
MSPGDVLEIEVTSKNQTSSQTILSQHALCLKAAGWFVQAYSDTQLADFGTMAFEDAAATVNGDFPWHPKGATIYDMQQNGQYLTSVSVDENSVTFKYTGP